MAFGLYCLALNPDVQTKVRQEVDSVLQKHGGTLTFDAVQDMTYLDMALSGKTVIYSSQITFLSENYSNILEEKVKYRKLNHNLCNRPPYAARLLGTILRTLASKHESIPRNIRRDRSRSG